MKNVYSLIKTRNFRKPPANCTRAGKFMAVINSNVKRQTTRYIRINKLRESGTRKSAFDFSITRLRFTTAPSKKKQAHFGERKKIDTRSKIRPFRIIPYSAASVQSQAAALKNKRGKGKGERGKQARSTL